MGDFFGEMVNYIPHPYTQNMSELLGCAFHVPSTQADTNHIVPSPDMHGIYVGTITCCSPQTGPYINTMGPQDPIQNLADPQSISKISIPGWWLSHSSEKYEFVSWDDEIPKIWKNKNVPNHQPVSDMLHVWFIFTNINPKMTRRREMRAFLTGGDGSTVDDEIGFKSFTVERLIEEDEKLTNLVFQNSCKNLQTYGLFHKLSDEIVAVNISTLASECLEIPRYWIIISLPQSAINIICIYNVYIYICYIYIHNIYIYTLW